MCPQAIMGAAINSKRRFCFSFHQPGAVHPERESIVLGFLWLGAELGAVSLLPPLSDMPRSPLGSASSFRLPRLRQSKAELDDAQVNKLLLLRSPRPVEIIPAGVWDCH